MITRRRFLKNSMLATTAAAGTTLSVAPHARALGANDDIRVAVVGFRGQGGLHLRKLRLDQRVVSRPRLLGVQEVAGSNPVGPTIL